MTSYLRYKQQIRTVQDADDAEIESWITVRGNHIPIKKGQSKEEAVKSFIEHQAGKNDLPQGTKWSPTNTKGEGTGNKPSQKKEKYNIQHGAKISDIESMINAHADKKAYKSWKEEEEYVAEKLKEEGIYAYGGQIKEAMKNVYGDAYTKERKEESKKPESSKKDTGSIIKQSKVEMTNGLKHITHTTPDGYKFSVWESSNDPGWKTNNLPADYFETESEATEAATKQFKKDLEYYNSEKANKKGKQLFEEKYGTKKTESKESKQPADIMDWKFEDVMKLPVSDPRVHKYIAKNNGLSISTVSTMAEGFGSTEDLYFEIDRISDRKGYGWDKIKRKATDSWHRLWGKK